MTREFGTRTGFRLRRKGVSGAWVGVSVRGCRAPGSYDAFVDVRLVSLVEAAAELGKDVSGLRKRVSPNATSPILSDANRKNVVLVDGQLIDELSILIAHFRAELERHRAVADRLASVEDKLEIARLELGEEKARSRAELQAMAEALEAAGTAQAAASRALRERVSRS